MRVRLVRLAVLCAAVVAFAAPLFAQSYTGRIDVTVADSTGAILPGVSLTITGPQSASAVTDEKGEAHFLNLAPGHLHRCGQAVRLRRLHQPKVPVLGGGSSPLKIALSVGTVAQTIDVSAESPLIDPARPRPRPTSPTRSCSRSRRRAIPGSCCRRSPASSSTASTSAAPNPASSRTIRPRVPRAARTPGTSTASRSPTCRRSVRRRPTTTSTCSRR